MALVAKKVLFNTDYESDLQAFYDAHPLLNLDDVRVHSVDRLGNIYLTYDNTKEQE